MNRWTLWIRTLEGLLVCSSVTLAADPLLEIKGADFQGGGRSKYGSEFFGRQQVNCVYAQPTKDAAQMTAKIKLQKLPQKPVFLLVEARNSDSKRQCDIQIMLNDRTLLEGRNKFSSTDWQCCCFPISPESLKTGDNSLAIINREPRGDMGQPPWFMVSRCVIVGEEFQRPQMKSTEGLHIDLPKEVRPFPEPMPTGTTSEPGFKFRGTKGWNWTPEQYLEEIPVLAKYKMNFLMNCYLSMFVGGTNGGDYRSRRNEWWNPMTDEKKEAYAKVIRTCRDNGIIFCFTVHPQLGSKRPLDPNRNRE
jgi:hypothetical protein